MKTALNQAIENYIEVHKNNRLEQSNLTTCLFKYTFPKLGFELSNLSQKRIHQKDKHLALEFSKTLQVNDDLPSNLLKAQESLLEKSNISNANKRHQRRVLKKFLDFLEKNKNPPNKKNQKLYNKAACQRKVSERSHIEKAKSKISTAKKDKFILSLSFQDYSEDKEYTKNNLDRIKRDFDLFEKFLTSNLKIRKISATINIKHIKRLLGWLYKIKNIPLEKISFECLIEVININVDIEDFKNINQYYINKGKLINEARKKTDFIINTLDDFFMKRNLSAEGKKIYIDALVSLSKFLYKDITDKVWGEDWSDIPIIVRLRNYRRKVPKDSKKIAPELMKWETVIKVLEETRRRADNYYYFHQDNDTKGKKGRFIKRRPRNKETIGKDLQRFIVLGLLTLVPPSRCRVIRELKIGKTFKHGTFKDGVFIPKEDLHDPKEAKYYIHLQSKDYKTGDKYGEWLAEFPNHTFIDGKTFYDYLDRWLYEGYREVIMKQSKSKNKHDFLLMKGVKGVPYTQESFSAMISAIFRNATGEKLFPHKLRTIFRTYVANKNPNQTELDSIAFWMRHSTKTAKEVYTKQTLDEKLNPGSAIANRLNSEILNSIT